MTDPHETPANEPRDAASEAPTRSIVTDEATSPEGETTITIKRTARVQMREAWAGWTQVLANIAIPVTLAFAVWGLLQDLQRQRLDAASRQVELFYTENLGGAQAILFAIWNESDMSILSTPQSRSFIDAFVSRTIASSDHEAREVLAAIVNLASYFDRAELCIERGRCDEDEMLSQLGDYGRDFYCLYAGQIVDLRSDTLILSIGHGLERFAERAGGCSAP